MLHPIRRDDKPTIGSLLVLAILVAAFYTGNGLIFLFAILGMIYTAHEVRRKTRKAR